MIPYSLNRLGKEAIEEDQNKKDKTKAKVKMPQWWRIRWGFGSTEKARAGQTLPPGVEWPHSATHPPTMFFSTLSPRLSPVLDVRRWQWPFLPPLLLLPEALTNVPIICVFLVHAESSLVPTVSFFPHSHSKGGTMISDFQVTGMRETWRAAEHIGWIHKKWEPTN